MGKLRVDGFEALSSLFDDLADLPDDVIGDMLIAEAEVIADEQRKAAAEMLQGPYYKGGVAGAVTVGKPVVTHDGGHIEVKFAGKQHGESLATIAFVNQYGARGKPGRPFISVANERGADKAVEAAAEVHEKWIESKN